MFLAQATDSTTNGTWAIAASLFSMSLATVGKWVFDYRKDKKEELYQTQKDAREAEDREKNYTVNVDIKNCLNQIEISNTKNHGDILLALTEVCKADCQNYSQPNQPIRNKQQKH